MAPMENLLNSLSKPAWPAKTSEPVTSAISAKVNLSIATFCDLTRTVPLRGRVSTNPLFSASLIAR